ncbi:MAG: murein L,D-transpeptidase family protein [Gemmatimonadaceae bacterium]
MSSLLLLVALLHAAPVAADTGGGGSASAPPPARGGSVQVLPPTARGRPLVDSIVVEKKAHRMSLFYAGRRVRQYQVALGKPIGDKISIGDRRTPEGRFWVDYRNPASQFYLALHISYPDSAHAVRALARGIEPGGDIMIHGLPNGKRSIGAKHRATDWTNGCVALTDEEIEEIFEAVDVGTPVEIRP